MYHPGGLNLTGFRCRLSRVRPMSGAESDGRHRVDLRHPDQLLRRDPLTGGMRPGRRRPVGHGRHTSTTETIGIVEERLVPPRQRRSANGGTCGLQRPHQRVSGIQLKGIPHDIEVDFNVSSGSGGHLHRQASQPLGSGRRVSGRHPATRATHAAHHGWPGCRSRRRRSDRRTTSPARSHRSP